jgi:hypothetical protein
MNNQSNNPAGRLLNVIGKLRIILKEERNLKTESGWAKLFDIDNANTGLVMARVGSVLQLTNQITEIIKKHKVENKIYFRDLNQIADAFRQMILQQGLDETLARIKEGSVTGLEYINDFLSRTSPEKTLDKTDLQKIYEDIMTLIDAIVSGDMQEYLRQYLLEKLDLLRQAIEMYNIFGIKPVENAINDILGSAALNKKIKESGDKEEVNKFVYIVLVALNLVGGFNDIAQLPESVDKVFPNAKQIACRVIESHEQNNEINSEVVDEDLIATEDVK